jgi:hypothetical protein
MPAAHKEWAKLMRSFVGGICSVNSYWDEQQQHKIDIFTSSNEEGVIAATIGLMDATGIPTEVIMDRRGHEPCIANILATIAFYIVKDDWKIGPGIIFEEMVRMYIPETKLPHVMFVAPWQLAELPRVALSDRVIFPLVAVPVSDSESHFARTQGWEKLESLWQQKSIDVSDWMRESVA